LEECPIYTGSLNSNAILIIPLSQKNGTCQTFFRLLSETLDCRKKKLDQADKENLAYKDFLYAPASARKKCTSLICELALR